MIALQTTFSLKAVHTVVCVWDKEKTTNKAQGKSEQTMERKGKEKETEERGKKQLKTHSTPSAATTNRQQRAKTKCRKKKSTSHPQ